jgi:endonuclease/exonuclease/phosphatase (EEP) superfamily protein YafD
MSKGNPPLNTSKRHLRIVLTSTLLLLAFSCVIPFIEQPPLIIDLASHFRAHFLVLSVIVALLCAFTQKYYSLTFAIICIGFNSLLILPHYQKNTDTSSVTSNTHQAPIKLLLSNVLSSNQQFQTLLDLIEQEQPDIITLQEVTPQWAQALKKLNKIYPYSHIEARQDNFGIAFYSRIPALTIDTQFYGHAELPSITAQITVGKTPLTIIASHPLPPINTQLYQLRNQQLQAIAKVTKTIDQPIIVLGDLNTSQWSSHFQAFKNNSRLKNARKGFGILPTWPSQLPMIGIAIDHILLSPEIHVESINTGPNIGSDHLPVIATITVNTVSQGIHSKRLK